MLKPGSILDPPAKLRFLKSLNVECDFFDLSGRLVMFMTLKTTTEELCGNTPEPEVLGALTFLIGLRLMINIHGQIT